MNRSILFITIVVLCSMIGQFATELYLPSMPAMARYFDTEMSTIQLTITTFALGVAISSFFCGYLSDKIGRLKVVFPCLLVSVVGSIICCVATSPQILLTGRFIQGIGFGGVGVVSRSIVRDISTSRIEFAKFASILGSVSAIAIAFAPIIGGYIQKYLFWRVNFIVLFLFAFVLAWLCRFKLEETSNHRGKIEFLPMVNEYLTVLKNKQFLLYTLISSLVLAGFVAYQTASSFLLQVQVGLSPDKFGYTSLFITIALILGAFVNGKIIERRGIESMMRFGAIVVSVAGVMYLACGYFDYMGVITILLPMMLFSFACGIVFPNAGSGALSLFVDKAGTAASIYNCFQMLGATLGSWVISSIVHKTQLPLGVLFIFIGMSGIIVYYNLKETHPPKN